MYVDPDRLLFMFDETILIFKINVFVYPPSNTVLKMAANPTKNTVIRRYLTENPALRPVIRRYGWTRCCLVFELSALDLVPYSKPCPGHNSLTVWNIFMKLYRFMHDIETMCREKGKTTLACYAPAIFSGGTYSITAVRTSVPSVRPVCNTFGFRAISFERIGVLD